MSNLLVLLVSLCVVATIHNIAEVWSVRQKVKWLKISLLGKTHGRWPLNIDTRLKTFVLHASMLGFFTGSAFALLKLADLSDSNLIKSGIMILLLNYAYATWGFDQFHREIGSTLKEVKRKNKL